MKNANPTLQIQGGKYKGKKLLLPSKTTTRSTKSIIKGSVFDTLQYTIVDQNFIEVFGGSGSMGLEALSRGAKMAYFFESDKKAYKVLMQNCQMIDASHTHITFGDSFLTYLPLVEQLSQKGEKAFIYFDPPFDIREGMEGIYDKVVELITKTPQDIVEKIIIEHMSKVSFPQNIGSFVQQKSKKFGKSMLTFYEVV